MVNNNHDVRKAASELFHRLIETKEIDVQEAKTGAQLLTVIQKSFMIDLLKQRSDIDQLPTEGKTETTARPFLKKISK